MSQLQGKAKKVCAMGNKRVFNDTSTTLMLKTLYTVELSEEKVLTAKEATKAVNAYTMNITNRYLYSLIL
jgi:hypothetical protein